jgi:oligopeptide/dipeptide ABC transporter ATP-binding protein
MSKQNITTSSDNSNILLKVENLRKTFPIKQSIFEVIKRTPPKYVNAVDDVSLLIYKGENLGIVGESGCGKTTFAKTAIQLYKPDSGKVLFEGKNLVDLNPRDLRKERVNFQMIFQDPFSSLNPRMTVREIISEALLYHKICTKEELPQYISKTLEMVGLFEHQADRFPGEFSGGQQQRVGIARALALKPKLIIADEPVSALDVSIQAQIIDLLMELQRKFNITILFISHDLRVVRYITQRVVVMYLGKIIEVADTEELYTNPLHPYTQVLLKSNPNLDPRIRAKEALIEGEPPSPIDLPKGCRFSPRCKFATDKCRNEEPVLEETIPGHKAACFFAGQIKDYSTKIAI